MSNFKDVEKSISEQEEVVKSEIKKLQDLHRGREPEKVNDYEFRTTDGTIKLSSLFEESDELLVIHNMGTTCPYCTMWGDGFNGYYTQLRARVPMVVVSNDSPETQREFSQSREWKFPMVSAIDNDFQKDMDFYSEKDEMVYPGLTIFTKDKDGDIYRKTNAGFGPGDLFCSIWNIVALLPAGMKEWQPKISY